SQPVTAAVPPGNERLFRMAMDVAADFVPVTHGEVEELKKVAEGQEPIFKLDI
ncbi:MAG: aldo/keto reductase, partial [Candidatus Latescibacterota bacterium]